MPRKAKPIPVRVTHLEMSAPPSRRTAMPTGQNLALMRVRDMPPAFYRYLYEQVGRPHHWALRRGMGDDDLRGTINASTTAIGVLYVDGSPAGFFEIDCSRPDRAEILYFGLTPDFQGRGLARFFLSEAIFAAWEKSPAKVIIQTNTLDNPRALRLYQSMGFSPVGWEEEEIEPWL